MPKNTLGFIPVVCYIMMIQGNVWYHQQLLLSSPSIQGTHFHQGHLRPGATDRLAPVGILLLLLLIMVQFVLLFLINLSLNFCSISPLSSSSLSLSPPSFSLSWSSSISSRYSILIQWIIQKGQFSKVLICRKFSPFPSIVPISILNCFWSIRRV